MKKYLTKVLLAAAMLPLFVMAQCPAPSGVTATNVAGSTALISWTAPAGASSYDVEYKTSSGSTWTRAISGTPNAYYYLSGLSTNTTYNVRVHSRCGASDSSSWATRNFTTNNCLGSGDVTLNSGTASTTYLIPLNNFYRYTYTQQIFTSAELGGTAQTITAISFQYAYSSPMTAKTNCVIYLGHTNQSTFSSTSNYVPLANLTQVYSGSLNCTSQGWNTFTLRTPFSYNGRDNLVLAIDDNSGSYNSSSYVFNTHSANNQCIYFYSDSYDPNPSNPTSAGASNSVYSYRSNVRFTMCNSTLPSRPAPVVSIVDVTHNAIELAWAPVGSETRWKVDYSTNMINWTSAGTFTSRSHRLSGLQSNTQYYLRVGAILPSDTIYAMVTVSTDCGMMSLPAIENFDNLSTGTGSPLNQCWTKLSDYSTGYPYVTNSYATSTPNSLYLYTYSNYYCGIVSPKSPEPINRLQVSFSMYKNTTSYSNDVMVGALTDPTDFSTFEPIDTLIPGSNTGYYNFTVPLNNYRGNGRYIGIFACANGSTSYQYLDNIEIDYYATCSRITNMQTQSNSPFSAISTWQPGRNGTPDYYIVSYTPASTISWTTDTTHSPYKVFSNLQGGETYYISVTPVCSGNDTSYPLYDTITTSSCLSQPMSVGTGGNTSINVPIETDVDYGYYQQIFDSIDLGGPRTYSAIAFNYTGSTPLTAKSNCTIYMANTTQSTFVSNQMSTLIPDSLFTVVYVGPLNCTRGWNVFTLDTTFFYDGTGNLAIAVDDNSGNTAAGSASFATHATTGNKSAVIGAFVDIDPMAPLIPPTAYNYCNDIMLYYCDTAAQCAPPTVTSTGTTDTRIDIAWAAGLRETSWTVERATRANGPWTYVATTNQRHYSFTNLNSSTRYYFRVGAICPNDTMYGITSDSTDCAYVTSFPFTESFESYASSSAISSTIGQCWTRKHNVNQTTAYPYVNTSYASHGSKSVYYYCSSNQYIILATPPMGVNVNTLMASFDLYKATSSYVCKMAVGVMTDPTDITTFVGIDTVWGSYGAWEPFTISLESYTGTGKYIAFVAPMSSEYNYNYLDNIRIDTIPNCPPVTNLQLSTITSRSAFASWNTGVIGNGITRQFIVEIKPVSGGTWTSDTTSNQYYFFDNLSASTNYQVRIKSVCTCGDSSEYTTTTFTTSSCLVGGQSANSIAQSNTTSYYMPIYQNAAYSYTQQLFTSTEIGSPRYLQAIEIFYVNANYPMSVKDSVTIYLGHTNKTTFTSYSDYVSFSDLTPVYTGSLNCTTNGWTRFTFDTPFYYNGVDNLVLAMDDNSGVSQGTSNYSFYVYTGTNKSLYYYSSSDVNPASPTGTSYGVYSYRNSIKFVSACNNSATCVPPNARILNKTATSVDLIWVPGYTDSVWVVKYKPVNDSIWIIADTTRNRQYTISNLSAMARYNIKITPLGCDDSTSAELFVRTGCGNISVYPYTEDFESYYANTSYSTYNVNNQLPDCWDFYSSGSYTHARRNDWCPRVYSGSSYTPNQTGKALMIQVSNYSPSSSSTYNYQTIGAHRYAVMPPFADSLPRYTISFKYRMSSTNTSTNYGMLHFGYVVNDTNFTSIASYPATNTAQTVFMDLSEDTTIHHVPGARFAFRCDAVYNYSSYLFFCIDDIEVGWAPTCIKPYDIEDVSVDSNTTRIHWKDGTVLSTTLGYEIIWGDYGVDPDTVTVNYATTSDTFYTISNLQPNTLYQCYIRALCGLDGDSKWSIPHTFRTAQIPGTMPYNCNFENTSVLNNGWTFISPSYGNNSWVVDTAAANNSHRSMYVSNSGGILNDYSNTTPTLSWAYRDIYVPTNGGNNFNLKFDWRCAGESNRDYLAVYFGAVKTVEANTTGTLVAPPNSTFVGRYYGNGTSYSRVTHQLPQLSDTVIRIYFAWVNDANSQGNNPPASVDNVSVKLDCPEPNGIRVTNITETSAKVTWRVTTGSYRWLFEYRPDGLNQWTSIPLNDTTYTLTNLNPSMSYLVRVRCMCTTIDTSDYSDSVKFSTVCGQIRNFPYTETFDNYGTSSSAYPTCWSYAGSATRPNCSAANYVTAPASLAFSTTANTQAIAVTPRMRVYNPYELEVSFKAYSTSTSNILIVGLMSDSTSAMSFIGVDTVMVSSANTWFDHVCDLSSYTGVGQFVGFKVGGSAASNFNIDNIVIDYHGADCGDPTNLSTVFGTNDMTCSWNEVADYEFEYCILGDSVWSPTTILTNTNNYHKTGLVDSTIYIWRIRTICPDSAGYSHWVYDTITTLALPCNTVQNVRASNITDTEITLSWDVDTFNNQSAWEIHCFDPESGVDTMYMVYTNPCRLTNMITGLTYHFTVRSLCTSGLDGGWSDTIIAIVAYCKPVKNVNIIPITSSSVNITWDITDPDQNMWEVEYGLRGFYEGDGTGTTVITATNSYTLTGLNFTTTYDVFVRARCDNGYYSIWTDRNRFALASLDVAEDEDNSVFLYPNPATSEVAVNINSDNGEYTIDVVDMKGRIVRTQSFVKGAENASVRIDVSDLARGTYFVKITSGEFKAVRKLITQ